MNEDRAEWMRNIHQMLMKTEWVINEMSVLESRPFALRCISTHVLDLEFM